MKVISSDELLLLTEREYHALRRAATEARLDNEIRFACEKCGFPVYAPLSFGRPLWKHFAGAPRDCEWWTGNPNTVDQASAAQFKGKQESPLHFKLKSVVAELLINDPRTQPGSVIVDKVLEGEVEYRRPDVRATYSERPIAIEIQLRTLSSPLL